jgi:hypothetical protein
LRLHHEAIAQYQAGDFEAAKVQFEALEARPEKTNCVVYELYIKRCETLIAHPPPVPFDGIFEHKTKG